MTVLPGTIVRQAPNGSSAQVGYVAEQSDLPFTGEENGWYRVILQDGTAGYVYRSRVTGK